MQHTQENEFLFESLLFSGIDEPYANHVVNCVKACEGINPKAVPDLLEACKYTIEQLKGVKGKTFPISPILSAITKAEEK